MPTQAVSSKTMDESILGDAALEPGQEKSIILGLYEKGFPQPEFQLDIQPRDCSISSFLEKANDGSGEYRLTYHVRNAQSTPCLVTVRELA